MYIFAVTLEGQVGRIALWDAVFHPVWCCILHIFSKKCSVFAYWKCAYCP